MSEVDIFKECHNSSKKGFSEPVKEAITQMETMMVQPLQEGEQPKSAAEVVAEVLTRTRPSNTLLKNVGLESGCWNKVSESSAAIAAHVIDLEERLDREKQQIEALREELAAIKKKSEETEAARNKEHQLLLKKSEENEARYAHLMEMLGKISGK